MATQTSTVDSCEVRSDDGLYQIQAEFCRAMAHPKRIQVLDVLRDGEMTVTQLAARTHIAQANLSQHLGIMRQQGLLRIRRQGATVYYSISDGRIVEACGIVKQVIRERSRREEVLFQGTVP
jgi:ArsR family transcriptional regulator, virulence genes transcriptional regulator